MQDKPAIEDFCPVCGAAIWRAQWCGFAVRADCTPIDTKTEIECFLTKRSTYGVAKKWPSFFLEYRWIRNIDRQYELILAKHKCGSTEAMLAHPVYWAKPEPPTFNI
jgi:hypothetical protein